MPNIANIIARTADALVKPLTASSVARAKKSGEPDGLPGADDFAICL